MSPLHWKRQTAVQAVAKNLPPKHILVRFIHQRFRVSLDEEPQAVLSQFDNEPHWTPIAKYPPFPHNYPPSMPVMRDADLVCTAFTPGSNAVIEWLGDALIRTAAVACVWNQARDCDDHQNNTTIAYLCSEPFLAHLAIFYGLHLHEHSEGQPRVIPSMARMCDTFESLVGAVASDTADNSDPHRGYLAALDWVQDLFDPWVAALCTPADSYKAPRISSVARRMYESCLRKFGSVPIASMGPPVVDAQGLVYGSEAPSVADEHRDWMAEILGPRPNWRNIDAMGISFPTDYPPAPPSLAAVNINTLTTVFTDVLYRIHIGHDICRLAVTALATAQLPTAAPGLLNEVRLECMEADLLARLGLLLRLDRYLRVLRPATADSADVYPRESADVFYAVVAVVYLEYGCAELLQWLDKLFSPWIIAAGDGTLRQSVAAEKTRQSRVLDEVLGRKLRQELRGKSSTRQQYATTVPSRKRRVVRARVAGRSDRYRVTTA
ncbi:hypothetical protein B0H14DRAFT_3038405 [Mycena olivaceomarginata]|nr:hypothetical protein B0H14DRAFT_3038405 [Mycena olivaceomarginata]